MKQVLIPTCFQTTHSRMSSQTLYGIQTIQNEIYCNVNEDYTVVSSEQNEVLHQRCSSKSSGTSSVDTFTIRARMENLEIALTMLNENFQRMENAMNKQIEKAIEIIIGTTGKDEKEETVLRTNDKYFMKSENKKLMKAVKFLTESSRIMRTALSEHTKFIDHITSVINQPTEVNTNTHFYIIFCSVYLLLSLMFSFVFSVIMVGFTLALQNKDHVVKSNLCVILMDPYGNVN